MDAPLSSSATALVTALEQPDPSLPERAVRATAFTAPTGEVVTSWKVAEHLYRSHTTVLPTLARGLFTTEHAAGEHRIVGRGYDKFFNVDEVAYTSWSAIEASTSGPYSLTLKSNGCLILISSLDARTLLVTSKHALDTVSERDEEEGYRGGHARVGREWVARHLSRAGRTEKELAGELWNRQVSAVAELCDDTFEEHVIPYPPHLTGLHLHGLSPLTPAFDSLPPAEVAAFARDWGFIETRFVELATVPEVRDYVRAVEHKGEWDGERVEGFVVRCTVASVADKPSSVVEAARPPYPAGSPFFFKVKFSQPYLLYRAFREITKSLLPIVDQPSRAWAGTPWTGADRSAANAKKGFVMTPELKAEQERKRNERDEMKARKARGEVVESGKAKAKKERASTHMSPAPAAAAQPNASTSTSVPSVSKDPVKVPPSQIRYPECTPYIFFVRRTMVTNPEWYTQFAQGKGIIHVREEFLRWLETEEGAAMLAEEKAKSRWRRGEKSTLPGVPSGQPVEGSWGKTLLIPVAIPGCGKTAIGLALQAFFGFGHEQSDDVKAKKTASEFNRNVDKALGKHDVVYADRNNHLAQHREELEKTATAASKGLPPRLIALNFALSPPLQPLPQHTLHRLCSARISARGERHQTLRAQTGNVRRHEDILWRFFVTAEPLAQDECDEIIQLRVEATLEDNLRTVLCRLKELMPALELPSEDRIVQVLEQVGTYDPDVKKTLMDAAKADVTRYYAVAPEVDLPSLTREVIRRSTASDDVKTAAEAFLDRLLENRRVTGRPHITLVHETEVELERLKLLSLAEEAGERRGNNSGPGSLDVGPWKRTWDQCVALANPTTADGQPLLFSFSISHLVFSEKVMSLVVSSLRPTEAAPTGTPVLADVPDLEHAHFTVGTADDSLRPYEGRLLVIEKRKAGALDDGHQSADGVLVLPEVIKGRGRVVGLG